jgi:hypothetical protein
MLGRHAHYQINPVLSHDPPQATEARRQSDLLLEWTTPKLGVGPLPSPSARRTPLQVKARLGPR